jgi:hypothetical protein
MERGGAPWPQSNISVEKPIQSTNALVGLAYLFPHAALICGDCR